RDGSGRDAHPWQGTFPVRCSHRRDHRLAHRPLYREETPQEQAIVPGPSSPCPLPLTAAADSFREKRCADASTDTPAADRLPYPALPPAPASESIPQRPDSAATA